MTHGDYTITRKALLQALPEARLLWRPDIGRIVLPGQAVPESQVFYYQDELNRHYYACGCDESAAGFFAGVILGSLWLASYWFEGMTPDLISIGTSLAFPVCGALIGKVWGKYLANQKLKQTIQSIQQDWQLSD